MNPWDQTIGQYPIDRFKSNLLEDDFYYDKNRGGLALSASDLKKHIDHLIPIRREATGFIHPLEFGKAVHQMFLEPDKFKAIQFSSEDVGDNQLGQLDLEHLKKIKQAVIASKEALQVFKEDNYRSEQPHVKKFNGHWLKCKVDIELDDCIWDIKSTSSLSSFDYTSRNLWHYPLSAYHYYLVTGKVMHYIVIEKNTAKVKIVKTDLEYYKEGRRLWEYAFNRYKKFLKMEWICLGNQKNIDDIKEFNKLHKCNLKQEGDKTYAWVLKGEYNKRR